MISIIILTKNEEQDLPKCLSSLSWADDIHILDSGSTDKTLEIAKYYNINIWFNHFVSFGQQRNYALDNINVKNKWILFLDADEITTPEFVSAVTKAISSENGQVAGYYLCWKMILEDKWLKRCDNFPKWQFRLIKKGYGRFTDFGHGQKEDCIKGEIKYIKEPYLHFCFSKGWAYWFERHNKYSSQEAISRINSCPPFKNIFALHSSKRNVALKSWLSRLPFWPIIRFLQAYIFNLGLLEGKVGLIYCINISFYEFMIQIKMRESLRR